MLRPYTATFPRIRALSLVRVEVRDKEEGEEGTPLFLALRCDKQSKSLNQWGTALAKAKKVDDSRAPGAKTVVCADSEASLDSTMAVAAGLYGACSVDNSTTAKLQARTGLAVVHAAVGRELYPPRWVMRELGIFLAKGRDNEEEEQEEQGECG